MAAIQVNMRVPEVLLGRIDAVAEGKRTAWILEACRMRLDDEPQGMTVLNPDGTIEPVVWEKPTIEDRKAIAMQAMSDALMLDHPAEAPETIELCGKEWPNHETGQWGRCGLAQGHRGNCGRFTVFDKVD